MTYGYLILDMVADAEHLARFLFLLQIKSETVCADYLHLMIYDNYCKRGEEKELA